MAQEGFGFRCLALFGREGFPPLTKNPISGYGDAKSYPKRGRLLCLARALGAPVTRLSAFDVFDDAAYPFSLFDSDAPAGILDDL